MRDAVKELGGDPKKINPICPSELVVDHSVTVDFTRSLVILNTMRFCMGLTILFAGQMHCKKIKKLNLKEIRNDLCF